MVEIDRYYETFPETSDPLQCVTFPPICLASETCIDNICQTTACMDNEGCEQSFCVDNRCVSCVESLDCAGGEICVSNECFPQSDDTVVCESIYNCIINCLDEDSMLPEDVSREAACYLTCELNTSHESSQVLILCLEREECPIDSLECMEENCLAEAVQCNLHPTFE